MNAVVLEAARYAAQCRLGPHPAVRHRHNTRCCPCPCHGHPTAPWWIRLRYPVDEEGEDG